MSQPTDPKPIPILYDTYLAVVRNSVGSKTFRNFYAYVNGEKKDLVNGGDLACGFFVSTVLHSFCLIKEPHLTVAGTEKDLQESGWEEVELKDIRPGAVVIWASQEFADGAHRHVGFYVGGQHAVSTDSKNGVVAEHHLTFNNARPIEKAYWHGKLDEKQRRQPS